MIRPLSIAHLTLLELSPPELIRVASQAGFSSVGLRLIAVTDTSPCYDLMNDPTMMRETLLAMSETGVTVNDIEFVRLTPEFNPSALEAFLNVGAELGAKHVIMAPYDPNLSRMTGNLAAFANTASGFGLNPVLEFFPWTNVPDLRSALSIVEKTENPNIGVLLDTLHFDRSGSTLADLSQAKLDRLPFIHLCDAPVQPSYSETELLHTARGARLIPNEGSISLYDIINRFPCDTPISLEIPMDDRRGLNALGLASLMFQQTLAFLNETNCQK